ncbi:MAG: sugar transferase [Verrucomicrobiaceae bacterium]|nr:MAG: sugar transferase [Verrucomicrobiaceae bacterium]
MSTEQLFPRQPVKRHPAQSRYSCRCPNMMIRRIIDMIVAMLALIITAPLLLGISVLIWLTAGAPIFFLQNRVGLHGMPFRMFKFRTMKRDAERSGGTLTFQADSRITPCGGILRRFKLDELPQFLNVLRGEMTLIGPRPEVMDWVQRYTNEQREVLTAKPGLSDPVQIRFRHEQDYLKSAAEYEKLFIIKVREQIEYLRSRTFLSDLVTAFRTLLIIIPSKPSAEELAVYAAIAASTDKGSKKGSGFGVAPTSEQS